MATRTSGKKRTASRRKTTAKSARRGATARKTSARKTSARKPARKTSAKKPARKTAARKPARKTAKSAARKPSARKTAARKAPARKPAASTKPGLGHAGGDEAGSTGTGNAKAGSTCCARGPEASGPIFAGHRGWRHHAARASSRRWRRTFAGSTSPRNAGSHAWVEPKPKHAALPAVLGERRRRYVGLNGGLGLYRPSVRARSARMRAIILVQSMGSIPPRRTRDFMSTRLDEAGPVIL
jgi:hypothetical protein